jgi:hypothetical protein
MSCGEKIHGARLVIAGRLTCPDCAYEAEYGPLGPGPSPAKLKKALPLQEERLPFPLPPARKKPR